MGTFILAIFILIVGAVLFHGVCDLVEEHWDKILNVGCGIVVLVAILAVCLFFLAGMAKSCSSDYPQRDYYEAPRK